MAKVYGGQLNAISRGLRLHRAGMKVLRGGVPSNEWTPIFDGLTTYGDLYNAWQPSGNDWEVEIEGYIVDVTSYKILLSSGIGTMEYFSLEDGVARVNLGLGEGGNSLAISANSYFRLTLNALDFIPRLNGSGSEAVSFERLSLGRIGTFFDLSFFHKGQIQRIKLLDNYDTGRTEYPVNGRNVVPLDGLTQYGEISAWSATNGVIEFQWSPYSVSGVRMVIDAGFVTGGYRVFINDGVVRANNCSVLIDGGAAPTLVENKVYTFRVTPSAVDVNSAIFIGSTTTPSLFCGGFMANLRLTDLDNPSNSRHYPLDRADIIQDVNAPDFPELFTDGNFSDIETPWVKTGGADVLNGSGVIDGTGGNSLLYQGVATSGKTYTMEFDVLENDNNNNNVVWDNEGSVLFTVVGIGRKSFTFTHGRVSPNVLFRASGGRFVVDNASIKETTQGNWINAPQAVHRRNNSIDINTVKRSKSAPLASDNKLVNKLDGQEVGELVNLTGWQPALEGGGLNRDNVPDKFEAFNGDWNSLGYAGGVNTGTKYITALEGGSWDGSIGVGDLIIAKSATVKCDEVNTSSIVGYTTLQGTDEQIQSGFQYPQVFRVIKPSDTSGEYAYLNAGNPPPWNGQPYP